MYVKSLRLNNFRNYTDTRIEFKNNINVIYGDNAQGKTNLLEALFICSYGRSHRTSKDSDLIMHEKCGYFVSIDIEKEYSSCTVDVASIKGERKKVRINKNPVKKIGELMGNLRAVMFAPEDLMIIKEGPGERRKFLDMAISQLRPPYFFDLQNYQKVLMQRNNLLREIQEHTSLEDTLPVWDEALVESGARLIKSRNSFITALNKKTAERHSSLTGDEEQLRLEYLPSVKTENPEDLESVRNSFSALLKKVKDREIRNCATLVGPQRDDFEIYINDKDVKTYGSQGQQRLSALSLKMAEIDIIKEETGDTPILLLDDVMSELDRTRQSYLIESIDGIQTFITTTDKGIFECLKNKDITYINVIDGSLTFDSE
ncbi:MAG: DNA replication/repair protein RecF [Eubacteriales bacterium]|nr:DNA replication/repair protein RecF [Eubacteriales bacterium]